MQQRFRVENAKNMPEITSYESPIHVNGTHNIEAGVHFTRASFNDGRPNFLDFLLAFVKLRSIRCSLHVSWALLCQIDRNANSSHFPYVKG